MNLRVSMQGIYVDPGLPQTWKYYMNLNGDYHQMDSLMTITSQDTFEEIPFTKESLDEHLITKRSYKEYGRFYKALVEKYPSQELLIKGILNPIPYGDSIDIEDHKILGYNTSLVEIQEQFLIPELQEYIDGVYDRYFNFDYTRMEPLYNTYFDAIIYANLPAQILLSRKRRRYTDLAHSYHIRMYLLSFSKKIGDEFNYLSRAQRLWLYRNIRYLNLNIGTNETLEDVVRNVMNARGFPVVATELEFDYGDMLANLHPGIKTYGVSLADLKGESLNVGGIDDVLGRQLIKAPLNLEYRAYDKERFEHKYLRSKFDKLTTKVLESNIIDKTDAEPFTFKSVILNYWPFLAASGYYNSKISVTVPSLGTVHQLDMLEAFVLYVYCVTAHDNVFLDRIPCIYIQRVLRLIPPRTSEIEALRMPYTPRYFLEYISKEIPTVQRMISVVAFNEKAIEIHRIQNDLREMRHFQGDYKIEGNLNQMIDRYFHSFEMNPYNNGSYSTWFEEREIEISTWTREDLIEVAGVLFEKCTGTSMSRGSALKDLHSAMVRVLDELTSYSVHMLTTVNDDSIKILDTKFPKLTVPESEENTKSDSDINSPYILKVSNKIGQKIAPVLKSVSILNNESVENMVLDVPVNLTAATSMDTKLDIPMDMTIPYATILRPGVEIVSVTENYGTVEVDYSLLSEELSINSDIYDQMTPNRMKLFLKQ